MEIACLEIALKSQPWMFWQYGLLPYTAGTTPCSDKSHEYAVQKQGSAVPLLCTVYWTELNVTACPHLQRNKGLWFQNLTQHTKHHMDCDAGGSNQTNNENFVCSLCQIHENVLYHTLTGPFHKWKFSQNTAWFVLSGHLLLHQYHFTWMKAQILVLNSSDTGTR